VRLILDRAAATIAVRHPEFVRFDGSKAIDQNRKELMDLSTGLPSLDVDGSPEPAANQVGDVYSMVNDPNYPDPPAPIFGGSMGDF
jgi:hypothetical protein